MHLQLHVFSAIIGRFWLPYAGASTRALGKTVTKATSCLVPDTFLQIMLLELIVGILLNPVIASASQHCEY